MKHLVHILALILLTTTIAVGQPANYNNAGLPVVYYDFELNSDRENTGETSVEVQATGLGWGAVTTSGLGAIGFVVGAGDELFGSPSTQDGRAYTANDWDENGSIDPGTSASDYWQFSGSSLGLADLVVYFNNQRSGTGPTNVNVLWSTDGSTFNALTPSTVTGTTFTSNSFSYALPSGANNQTTLIIRVYGYGATMATGTFRIDNFMIQASTVTANLTLPDFSNVYDGVRNNPTDGTAVDSYTNLTLGSASAAADVTLSSDFQISGTLTIAHSGSDLVLGANNLTYGATSLLSYTSTQAGFTRTTGSEWSATDQPRSVTINLTGTGTNVLTLDADKTFTGATNVLTVTSGILDATTRLITFPAAGGSVSVSGTVRTSNPDGFSSTSTTTIVSTNAPGITLNTGSRIVYNAAGAQTVTSATNYSDLEIAGSGTKTLDGVATVDRYLFLTAGTLDNSTNNVTLPTGSIVRRTAGTIAATPNYTGERSVQYAASVTAGPELAATVDSLQIVTASTTLTLNGSVNATDRLGFTGNANRINLAGNALTVGDASTEGTIVLPVTTPANGSWVHSGTFTRFVNSSTASLELPIGTSSFDRRATIAFGTGNAAGTTVSVFHYDFQATGGHPGIENTTFPLSVGGGLDIDGSDQVASFYWSFSSAATENYTLALRGYGMVAVADPDQLRILRRANADGAYSSPGTFDAVGTAAASLGNVTIVHTGLNGFSQYALATTEADVLPVTWLAVAAERVSAGAEVSWSTASELNNERFEVERSASEDFGRYVTVGQVAGRGTSQTASSYRLLDSDLSNAELMLGPVYYRIRQVDFDGRSSLSRVVRLDAAAEWAVYPNPVTGPLQLVGVGLSRTDAPVRVQLMGADGRTLVDLTAAPASVAARVDAALNQAGAGLYVLRVGGKTIRLVKP